MGNWVGEVGVKRWGAEVFHSFTQSIDENTSIASKIRSGNVPSTLFSNSFFPIIRRTAQQSASY